MIKIILSVERPWWSQRIWENKELPPKEVSYDDLSSRFKAHTKAWKEKAGRIQMKHVSWRGWWTQKLSIKLVPKPKHLEGSTPWWNPVLILTVLYSWGSLLSDDFNLCQVKKEMKERKPVSKPAPLKVPSLCTFTSKHAQICQSRILNAGAKFCLCQDLYYCDKTSWLLILYRKEFISPYSFMLEQELKAETWRQELIKRPWRNVAYRLVPPGLLS